MKTRCLAAVLLLWFVACGERNSLHSIFTVPPQMTLYSIREDQVPHSQRAYEAMDIEVLPLLGKTDITNPQTRQEIIDALNQAVISKLSVPSCFNPRHGMRAIDGVSQTDYIICFECDTMHVINEGKRIEYAIDSSAQEVLNKFLREANVPLNPSR